MMEIQQKIAGFYPQEGQSAQADRRAAELTHLYGKHSLAFFGMAPENLHFLTDGGTGLVNYQLTGNVAVVLGDPVCAPEAQMQVMQDFLDFCTFQKWRVAL